MECAECHAEIKESYFTIRDNFLQMNFFEEQYGSDNIFCSYDCLHEAIMAEEVLLNEED